MITHTYELTPEIRIVSLQDKDTIKVQSFVNGNIVSYLTLTPLNVNTTLMINGMSCPLKFIDLSKVVLNYDGEDHIVCEY
jgi:hypothetical protein